MYRWIWDRLPGPSAVRVAIFAAAALGSVLLVLTVISPALAPSAPDSSLDTLVGESDVTEPDGVRSSPRPVAPEPDVVPIIPEDTSVPQP
jgi:hypothetical protein